MNENASGSVCNNSMDVDYGSDSLVDDAFLEQYQEYYESKTHWHARRELIKLNWCKFEDKDRLICLSTAWSNWRFMGNLYPAKVMSVIKEMAAGVGDVRKMMEEVEETIKYTGPPSMEDGCDLEPLPSSYFKPLPGYFIPVMFVKSVTLPGTFDDEISDDDDGTVSLKTRSHEAKPSTDSATTADNQQTAMDVDTNATAQDPSSKDKPSVVKERDSVSNIDEDAFDVSTDEISRTSKRPKIEKSPTCDNKPSVISKPITLAPKFPCENHVPSPSFDLSPIKSRCDEISSRNGKSKYSSVLTKLKDLGIALKKSSNKKEVSDDEAIDIQRKQVYNVASRLKCKLDFEFHHINTKEKILHMEIWSNLANIDFKYDLHMWICEIFIDSVFICHGCSKKKTDAKYNALTGCLHLLQFDQLNVIPMNRTLDKNGGTELILTTCPDGSNYENYPPPPKLSHKTCSEAPTKAKKGNNTSHPPAFEQSHTIAPGINKNQKPTKLLHSLDKPSFDTGPQLNRKTKSTNDSVALLQNFSSQYGKKVKYVYGNDTAKFMTTCKILLGGKLISSSKGKDLFTAKEIASNRACTFLQKQHPAFFNSSTSSMNQHPVTTGTSLQHANSADPLFNFVLVKASNTVNNFIGMLTESCQFSKKKLDFKLQQDLEADCYHCTVFIQNQSIVSTTFKGTKKEAKTKIAQTACEILEKTYPVLELERKDRNVLPGDNAITRDEMMVDAKPEANKPIASKSIGADNVGNQLLRKMGWSGSGGLGKEGAGISAPIEVTLRDSRACLGQSEMDSKQAPANAVKLSLRQAKDVMERYARSDQLEELVFSNEFSNEERAKIHQFARRFNLVSKSYGKGQNRYLTVKRKVNSHDILRNIQKSGQVNTNDGSFTLVQPKP